MRATFPTMQQVTRSFLKLCVAESPAGSLSVERNTACAAALAAAAGRCQCSSSLSWWGAARESHSPKVPTVRAKVQNCDCVNGEHKTINCHSSELHP